MSDLIERLSKVEDSEREAWISRQEASLLRSGFKEESARRISERFYDLHLRRNDPIELCVQNSDGSFSRI